MTPDLCCSPLRPEPELLHHVALLEEEVLLAQEGEQRLGERWPAPRLVIHLRDVGSVLEMLVSFPQRGGPRKCCEVSRFESLPYVKVPHTCLVQSK